MAAIQFRDFPLISLIKSSARHRHGIAYQLIFSILVYSSFITLLGTVIQLYFDYSQVVELLEERMDQIQISYLEGITNSIWITDLNQAKLLMEGVIRLPDMEYSEFLLGGESLVAVGKLTTGNTIDRTFELKYKHLDSFYHLGSLHVVASLEGVYQRIWDKILVILFTQGIKTFLVSTFILVIVQWLVTRHLSNMANDVKKMNAQTLDRSFSLKRKPRNDELEQVLDALNRMRTNLQMSYQELTSELEHSVGLEKELTEYKNHLEERVKEQTIELLEANQQINQSLEDKDVLLREIHHRVKNNMQIISSMLRLQVRHVTDDKHRELFKEMQNRIQAMALVHENLYQSENLTAINTQNFVKTMVREIQDSYTTSKRIQTTFDVDDIEMGIDSAIPCGLIINELMTNSFKYAFVDRDSGDILIQIKRQGSQIHMSVRDNGIGMSKDIDPFKTKSMGLRLITILSKQLNADYQIDLTEGSCFNFIFEEKR